jgi:hypothetical protein
MYEMQIPTKFDRYLYGKAPCSQFRSPLRVATTDQGCKANSFLRKINYCGTLVGSNRAFAMPLSIPRQDNPLSHLLVLPSLLYMSLQ